MKKLVVLLVGVLFTVITLSNYFNNIDQNDKGIHYSLNNIIGEARADGEIDPREACYQCCWTAEGYFCTLWVTGTSIYIDCLNMYPYL